MEEIIKTNIKSLCIRLILKMILVIYKKYTLKRISFDHDKLLRKILAKKDYPHVICCMAL